MLPRRDVPLEACEACSTDDEDALRATLATTPCTIVDARGNTLLHLCCANDALRCAKLVVSRCVFASTPPERAYLTLRNSDGETAADVAEACGSARCAEWLAKMTGAERVATNDARRKDAGKGERRRADDERRRKRSGDGETEATTRARESLVRSIREALNIGPGDDGDERAAVRQVLREVLNLVSDRESARRELEEAHRKIEAMERDAERERANVVEALGMAEKRAKEMISEREAREKDICAEKTALSEALNATGAEYEAGYAKGWADALQLPSREYVRAQMKLEKSASASSASESATPALATDDACEAFADVSLDGSASIASRVTNVFKETFVGVKKRVDELEKSLTGSAEKKNPPRASPSS